MVISKINFKNQSNNPKFAYLLGFLWGDGSLTESKYQKIISNFEFRGLIPQSGFAVVCLPKRMNVALELLSELIEIILAGLNVGDEFFVVNNPISVHKAISKIKERLQLLEEFFGNDPFLIALHNCIDIT